MKYNQGELYHVYNRGINKQRIFYNNGNYYYFLEKVRKYLVPHCDILAYSLLPNHFHFLITPNEQSNLPFGIKEDSDLLVDNTNHIHMTRLSHGFQMLLSSYAKAINHQHKRTGSLFTQNTKSKRTSSDLFSMDYSLWCFLYIHNNPVVAGLSSSAASWAFSSYREYLGKVQDPICNIELGKKLLSLEMNELFAFDGCEIPDHIIDQIL
jgi:REP element-mobilizing transposase RayT